MHVNRPLYPSKQTLLRAKSVGFRPISFSFRNSRKGGIDFHGEGTMTLEQKINRGLREGNQAVFDGLLFAAFGEAARLWFEGEPRSKITRLG